MISPRLGRPGLTFIKKFDYHTFSYKEFMKKKCASYNFHRRNIYDKYFINQKIFFKIILNWLKTETKVVVGSFAYMRANLTTKTSFEKIAYHIFSYMKFV